MLMIFPISLAYVIVVQRAMDVRMVVRQGLQYALARRGTFVIQLLLTLAIVVVAARELQQKHSLPEVIAIVGLGLRFDSLAQKTFRGNCAPGSTSASSRRLRFGANPRRTQR